MKKGIDVSKYQGNINWEQVKAAGYEFAILRAGYGANSVDGKFKRNADECTRLGIPFGAYWFSYALSVEHAKREAQSALKVCSPYKLSYGIWFDFEYDSVSYATNKKVKVSKQLVSDMARAFMNTIKAAGVQTGNYTNLDFGRRMFDSDILNNWDRWAARYTSKQTDIVNGAELWQYSSSGKVPGIVGNVDMDYALVEYPRTPVPAPDVPVTPGKDTYPIPAAYRPIFDADWYYKTYPDLQQAVKEWVANGSIENTPDAIAWQLFQHFLMIGMDEYPGRRGNATFDVGKYKAAYVDLQVAFGDGSYKPYYNHYITTGAKEIAEGKRAPF